MKRPFLPVVVVTAALLFVLSFFWPGPYRYDELGAAAGRSYLVRGNRFTGRTEIFVSSSGWMDRDPGAIPPPGALMFGGALSLALTFGVGFALGRRGEHPRAQDPDSIWDRPTIHRPSRRTPRDMTGDD